MPSKFTQCRKLRSSHVRKQSLRSLLLLLLLKVHSPIMPAPPRAPTAPGAPPASAQRSWSCPPCWAGAPPTERTASRAPVHHPLTSSSLGRDLTRLEGMRLRGLEWASRRRLTSPCPASIRSSRSAGGRGELTNTQTGPEYLSNFWELHLRMLQISGSQPWGHEGRDKSKMIQWRRWMKLHENIHDESFFGETFTFDHQYLSSSDPLTFHLASSSGPWIKMSGTTDLMSYWRSKKVMTPEMTWAGTANQRQRFTLHLLWFTFLK